MHQRASRCIRWGTDEAERGMEAGDMKKPWYASLTPPVAAIAIGAVILLGVLLSFRFALAMTAIALIGWGVYRCTRG